MKSFVLGFLAVLGMIAASLFYFQYWKSSLTSVAQRAEASINQLARDKENFQAQYQWKLDEMDKVTKEVNTTLRACFAVFEKAVSLLERAGEDPKVTDADSAPSEPLPPTQPIGWTAKLKERESEAKKELDRLLSDPKTAELYEFYKRNENRFEEWSLGKFIEDPKINPNRMALSDQDMIRIEIAYHRAVYRIKMKDTERELALQRAVAEKLMEQAEYVNRGEEPPKPGSRFIDAVAVVQSNNMNVIIPRDEHPEIGVLLLERDPEIARWLKEVGDFFVR
jgi:hypothetical protein